MHVRSPDTDCATTGCTLISPTTTELLYVCDKVSATYLSQTALKRLGIIDNTFPISEVANLTTTPTPAQCGCPLRAKCLPISEKLPFPATDEHRKDLEHWIKTQYVSSAFNICPHQKLQTMTDEALNIAFLPEHIPTAVHKPIPMKRKSCSRTMHLEHSPTIW